MWRRVIRAPIQVFLAQGWRLEFPTWSELAGITLATGLHEPAEELFAFAYVRPGDSVVDVGANLGIYTVACASLGARVSSFEPSSQSRHALKRNITLNELEERVRIFPIALGEETATIALTTDLDVRNHVVAPGEGSQRHETVQQRPLDSVVESEAAWFGVGEIALLKIDAEGLDAAVLRGAQATLASDRPVVVVETWHGGTEIRAFLADRGYRVYRYEFESRRLVEYPATWSGQANFIAIADQDLVGVRQRIDEATAPMLVPPRVRWRVPTD